MTDVEFDDLRNTRYRPHILQGKAVSGVAFQAQSYRLRGRPLQSCKFHRLFRCGGVAVLTGMQFNRMGAGFPGRLNLMQVGVDEKRDLNAGLDQFCNPRDQCRKPASSVESPLSGELFSAFGNNASVRRPGANRKFYHLIRRGHFKIERQTVLGTDEVYVLVRYVSPVFSQVRSDSVRARCRRRRHRAKRVGHDSTTRIPKRCNMIDVHAESEVCCHY